MKNRTGLPENFSFFRKPVRLFTSLEYPSHFIPSGSSVGRIRHTEALKSMAFIKTDQPFLTGKDHSFLSPFPGQICKIFHQFSCDSLMSVCREYIQAKHCLIGPLGIVKTYIMIHLIRKTWFIC